jgi:HD superfamily phosphohydrolase
MTSIPSSHWTRTEEHVRVLSGLGLEPLLATKEFLRLGRISFLGTLDVLANLRRSFSRLEHSVGVAMLALTYSDGVGLPAPQRTLLLAGTLLHDIGHAPLSHVAETLLLERMRRYHEAVGAAIVRRNWADFDEDETIGRALRHLGTNILDGVRALLAGGEVSSQLSGVFSGATSVDAFFGITRTAWALGEDVPEPTDLARLFEAQNGQVVLPDYNLRRLRAFWDLQERVYKEKIYTDEVLAAEAMVTRALELGLPSKGAALFEFARAVDDDAWDMMEGTPTGHDLVRSLRTRALYRGLASANGTLVRILQDEIAEGGGRFAFDLRRVIEARIAKMLDIPPEHVITHYSFTREFKGSYTPRQHVFDFSSGSGGGACSLEEVHGMFYIQRASGSRFDVFVPPEVDSRRLHDLVTGHISRRRGYDHPTCCV